jgi:hypothetical protein
LNRENPLMETAIFGREVQEFLSSNVGKYLVKRAEEEAQEANAALKNVFPMRWRRITDLQNRIYRAESVQKWLGEAIMDGIQAERIITGEDNG